MIKNIQSLQITGSKSIREAMKQLDDTAEKILFVVDHNQKLIGSLTDGDIRRWILKGGELEKEISQVCFKNCLYVYKDYKRYEERIRWRRR